MKTNSIAFKLISILLIIILTIMILYGFYNFFYEKEKEIINIKNELSQIIQRLCYNLENPIWNYDIDQIKIIVELEANSKNVLSIIIKEKNNNILYGIIKDIKHNKLINYEENKENIKLLKRAYLYEKKDIFRNNKKISFVELYFTDYFLNQKLKNIILRTIILTAILFIIILITIVISFDLIILKPLKYLENGVLDFSQKKFNTRLTIKSNDEFGNLYKSFNDMAQIIQNYSEHLQELVENRTQELNNANKELKLKNQQIMKELKMAQRIQEAIIPKNLPSTDIIKMFGKYQPMDDLGGDFYDVIKINDKKFGIVIADVCGHGVPAALITMIAKVSFYSNTKENRKPSEIVKLVNNEIFNAVGGKEYLTAFYCIIDIEKGILEYTNAGHNPIYLFRKDNSLELLKSNSFFIGISNINEFFDNTIILQDNDRIVLYTDGIPETQNEYCELFSKEFEKILIESIGIPQKDLIEDIISKVNKFRGKLPISDDMTILIVDIISVNNKLNINYEVGLIQNN